MPKRRRRRTKVQRIINLIRKTVAFLFSHVGLCALVVGYTVLGALTFREVERPHERVVQHEVVGARHTSVRRMWETTYELNILYEDHWSMRVLNQVLDFKRIVTNAVKQGYDGKDTEENPQWSFSGAFLYALTVVTTIGYGHIAPRTFLGKGLTIIYAILGIPLMLLFLTNIGDILAKTFKFIYSRLLWLKIHLILKYRRKRANRLKRQNSLQGARAKYSTSGRSLHATHSGAKYDDFSSAGPHGRTLLRNHPDFSQDSFDAPQMLADEHDRETMGAASSSNIRSGGGASRSNVSQMNHSPAAGGGGGYAERGGDQDAISARESLEQQLLQNVTVPVSVSLLVMTVYLIAGAVLFCIWEKWTLIDGTYFCFVTLTTIGLGDLVPGRLGEEIKLVICSLYLLFGMALIAMCFNLAQEEVVNKISRLATRLGIFKNQR